MLIIATDLDGTFLGGTDADKANLYRLIRQNDEVKLIFVTGRGLESVKPLFTELSFPRPDYIICDVGATVVDGKDLEPFEPLQSTIAMKWPGSAVVRGKLETVSNLRYQEVPQSRRCSFFYNDQTELQKLYEIASSLECEVVISAGRFLDVLPKGISKGSTLVKLVESLQYNEADILVAGDTMNDFSLYDTGFRGVVVGEAEESLVEAVKGMKSVYVSKTAGAGGILEAMEKFTELNHYLPDTAAFKSRLPL